MKLKSVSNMRKLPTIVDLPEISKSNNVINNIIPANQDAKKEVVTISNINEQEMPKDILIPDSIKNILKPHQITGYYLVLEKLYSSIEGCILAYDMGTGKTLIIMSVILYYLGLNLINKDNQGLIVVPKSLISIWLNEFNKFAPNITIQVYHDKEKLLNINSDIIICTYDTIRTDINIKNKHYFMVILDEAQKIKNPHAKITEAVGLLKGTKKIAMTGTPIENNIIDVLSICNFIKPHKYAYLFNLDYKELRMQMINYNKLDNIKTFLISYLIIKTKEECNIKLPEKTVKDVYCDLTYLQQEAYVHVLNKAVKRQEMSKYQRKLENFNMRRNANILKPLEISIKEKLRLLKLNYAEIIKVYGIDIITFLKQICNHPYLYDSTIPILIKDSGKMIQLDLLLKDLLFTNGLINGTKILIFTQYVQTLNLIEEVFSKEGYRISTLHGLQSREDREGTINDFNNPFSDFNILLISLKAGSTGLTFTIATHVILFDPWWNSAVHNQAANRIHRIGQTKPVIIYNFITQHSIEISIKDFIHNKDLTIKHILGK